MRAGASVATAGRSGRQQEGGGHVGSSVMTWWQNGQAGAEALRCSLAHERTQLDQLDGSLGWPSKLSSRRYAPRTSPVAPSASGEYARAKAQHT